MPPALGITCVLWLWVQHEPGGSLHLYGLGYSAHGESLTSGVRELMLLREDPSSYPVFPLPLQACSLGKAVGGCQLVLVQLVFILHASGALCCVEGRLFVFILHFFSEVYDFFIRVKICQMAISDCLEIMRLWNLLKHKCQKKITAVSLAFLVSLLDVNFPCLLMCAFYAGIKSKNNKKKTLPKKDATIINYFSMSAVCMLCMCVYVCRVFHQDKPAQKNAVVRRKKNLGGRRERPDARKPELNLSLFSL